MFQIKIFSKPERVFHLSHFFALSLVTTLALNPVAFAQGANEGATEDASAYSRSSAPVRSLSDEFARRGQEANAADLAERRAVLVKGANDAVEQAAKSKIAYGPQIEKSKDGSQIDWWMYLMVNHQICAIAVSNDGHGELTYVWADKIECR